MSHIERLDQREFAGHYSRFQRMLSYFLQNAAQVREDPFLFFKLVRVNLVSVIDNDEEIHEERTPVLVAAYMQFLQPGLFDFVVVTGNFVGDFPAEVAIPHFGNPRFFKRYMEEIARVQLADRKPMIINLSFFNRNNHYLLGAWPPNAFGAVLTALSSPS